MNRYIIAAVCMLMQFNALAATYTSTGGGDWKTSGNWDNGVPPLNGNNVDIIVSSGHTITLTDDIAFNNNCSLTVYGDLTIDGAFTVNNNLTVTVTGTLNITGAMTTNNNAELTIDASGNVDIGGDFSGGNNVVLDVDGNMDVTGDFSLGTGSTITGTPGAITVGGTITNDGTDLDGVLPVVLEYFMASAMPSAILIEWKTLSELNNDYFTIERSENGLEFQEISRVQGSGTTEQPVYYQYMDTRPLPGLSYYRLKQTDFDGTTETFRMVAVQFTRISADQMVLYPNPVPGDVLRIEAHNFLSGKEATVSVTDLSGRVLIRRQYQVEASGVFREELDALGQLPRGIYILDLIGTQKRITRRFIKQ